MNEMSHGPGDRSRADAIQALAGVRGVLFDLDGVLYRWEQAIPGACEFVKFLADAGIPYAALSNNSQTGPENLRDRLARLGMHFPLERIITSATAAASYVAKLWPGSRVHVVGSSYMHQAMANVDVQCVGPDAEKADVVALGMSMDLTMVQLAEAVRMLRDGAELVATNPDAMLPVPGGFQPECGAVAALLEMAGGRTARFVGKPNPEFFTQGLAAIGRSAGETLMIGDTLEVDILGATESGLCSAFVATGNPIEGEPDIEPTVFVDDLFELRQLLQAGRTG